MVHNKPTVNALFAFPLVGLIAGITLQSFIGCSLVWGIGISMVIGLVALLYSLITFTPSGRTESPLAHPEEQRQATSRRTILITLLFFCVGLIIYPLQRNHNDYLRDHYTGKSCTIIAEVDDVQTSPGNLFEGIAHLTVNRIKPIEDDHYENTSFSFLCYNKEAFDLEVGDELFFENITLPLPSSSSLAQNTPFGDYLIKENIVSAVFLQKKDMFNIINRINFSLSKWIWQQKTRVLSTIKKSVSPLAYSYFALIFLGYKQLAQNHELRKVFNLWGLAHFLARAGLHIMLFIWLWQLFLSFLPLSIIVKRIILFLVCFTYALFSWSSIPFFRAYVVFVLARIAHFLDQQTHFLHLLTVTCLFVLLLNPIQLFFLDFQLTFALTFVLGWFSQISSVKQVKKII